MNDFAPEQQMWLFDRGNLTGINNPLKPGTFDHNDFEANGYCKNPIFLGLENDALGGQLYYPSDLPDYPQPPYQFVVWLRIDIDKPIFVPDLPSLLQLFKILTPLALTATLYNINGLLFDQWWEKQQRRERRLFQKQHANKTYSNGADGKRRKYKKPEQVAPDLARVSK